MTVICESLDPDLRPKLVREIDFVRKGIPIVLLSHSGRAQEYVGSELPNTEGEPLDEVLSRLLH